jgi:hypothetical protein
MDQCTLGVALAVARIAELHRQADRWRLASGLPGRTGGRRRDRRQGRRATRADPARPLTVQAAPPPRRPRPAAPSQPPRRQPC